MYYEDDDPIEAASTALSTITFRPSATTLVRIQDNLAKLSSHRHERANAQRDRLDALSRRLNRLRHERAHSREKFYGSASATGAAGEEDDDDEEVVYAEAMLELENVKFQSAKRSQAAGMETDGLEGELGRLEEELEELELEGVEGGKGGMEDGKGGGGEDEVVLKIQFYRSLGIEARTDPRTGEFSRAIIGSSERKDVGVVNFDGNLSREYYANLFWDSL